ncbi:hypothetical protein HON52_03565 [Candidatus Uhrbacteria bacterium]|jgi:HTH-type transcriptional regulator, sugar sensing transcriptional regulator|nr:hypothetical protein [Candidatus Uhrbacteria bacterium]
MKDLKEVLTKLGLTDTETRMYLAMLTLGPESVQNISRKAGVSRTAAYDLIGALQHKGLASSFQRGKKKFFSAEDPDKLDDYFKGRMTEMKGQLDVLKRLMPELRVMSVGGGRPRVRFYTGEQGLRALFRDVVSVKSDELLEVANIDTVYDQLDESVLLDLRKTEHFKHVPIRVLIQGEPRNMSAGVEARVIDKAFGDFVGIIWIYADRVAMINLIGDMETVIIEQQIFSDTMRVLFNTAWSTATPYKK